MITMAPSRESAKIYQFPERARVAQSGRGESADRNVKMPNDESPRIDFGEAWYHAAAIANEHVVIKR